MIPALWIAISTVCLSGTFWADPKPPLGTYLSMTVKGDQVCIQVVRTSTSPITARDGESVYRVVDEPKYEHCVGSSTKSSPDTRFQDLDARVKKLEDEREREFHFSLRSGTMTYSREGLGLGNTVYYVPNIPDAR